MVHFYIAFISVDQFCPEEGGWELLNDYCYMVSDEEMTWTAAQSYCKTYGGDLASINAWDEQDFIRGMQPLCYLLNVKVFNKSQVL